MRLKYIEVSEFQSIRKSNRFEIGEITCLVGKNESGKTALLQSIYRLNPIIKTDGNYDVTDDYPRSDVEDYQQDIENGKRQHAIVAEATFLLDKGEIQLIENDFGKGIFEKNELILSKGYENNLLIGLNLNEKTAISSLLEKVQLPSDLIKHFSKFSNFDSLVEEIGNFDDKEKMEHINRLQEILKEIQDYNGLVVYIYNKYLESLVPKFLYFDEYFLMRGHENIQALKSRMENNQLKKSDYPLLGLIALARLDLDELIKPKRTEWLISKLEGAGNHLSKKILKYWSQNKHLQIKFDVRPASPEDPDEMTSGTNLWGRVYDSKHMVTTLLGTRSRGFVWFFSFLAWFDQQQKKQEPLILLLDEPGLFLHGKAQGDLLNYMEKELKGNHQVIYTTHSPFMVDPQKFERVRIVQDKSMDILEELPSDEEGTKVFNDVLKATDDSLFPLQGALGYEIHQTLFIGPNCLVVEGVSDLLYLQTISGVLESQNREGLDQKWIITPVGGSDKVPTFVALLGSQRGLTIATLIDIQKKDQQTIYNLYKKKLLKKKNVLTFGDFTGEDEADIEDMFTPGFYLKLVNAEFGPNLNSQITINDLNSKSKRILVKVENYFSKNPMENNTKFNHYRPARYFAEKINKLQNLIPNSVLEKFETAFKAINSLL